MLYQDLFRQADESPLSSGGKWTDGGVGNRIQVVSNRLRCAQLDTSNARLNLTFGNDQFVEFVMPSVNPIPGATTLLRAVLRYVDATNFYEIDFQVTTGNPGFGILLMFGAGQAPIGGNPVIPMVAGDKWTSVICGSTLAAYRNGALIQSITDTGIPTSGTLGIALKADGNVADIEMSNFNGGDFPPKFGSLLGMMQ